MPFRTALQSHIKFKNIKLNFKSKHNKKTPAGVYSYPVQVKPSWYTNSQVINFFSWFKKHKCKTAIDFEEAQQPIFTSPSSYILHKLFEVHENR